LVTINNIRAGAAVSGSWIGKAGRKAYLGSNKGYYTHSFQNQYDSGMIPEGYIKVSVKHGDVYPTFWQYAITNSIYYYQYIPFPKSRVKF